MSKSPSTERTGSGRWVMIALLAIALLVVAGVVGVPWVVRDRLIADQATCCELARAFERERPGALPDGPVEVGQCLEAVVDRLGAPIRDRLEQAQVDHDRALRRPSEPLSGSLLNIPLGAEVFAAVDRCAGAHTSRWRTGHGLAVQGLLERHSREAHLLRDPDQRLAQLMVTMGLWLDAYAIYDVSIIGPVLWARELGQTGGDASAEVRAEAAERLRALAASLPDLETTTAIFYCKVYGEVRELDLFTTWEANEQFGASLAMAAGTEPAAWGREPAESRLDRAIPSGVQDEQFVEPGSAYLAGTLMLAAQLLDPADERFLGRPITEMPLDDAPMSVEPCHELVLPSALDDRPFELCALEPQATIAARELGRIFRAVRTTALAGGTIPERIDDLAVSEANAEEATEPSPVAPPCAPSPRPATAIDAWRAIGFEPRPTRRVALTLMQPEGPPPPSSRDGVDRYDVGWRLLRARWRSTCDGPVHEARLWIDGPADDPHANPLELGEVSEPAAQGR